MEYIVQLVLVFFAYSLAGWCLEVILKYIQYHRFINRGFLTGPICPIYGSGAVLITVAVGGIAPFSYSCTTTFLVSFLLCGALEYLTSYVMEKRFHARWWDYSQKPMNLHGRVWIGNLILFGLGGVAIIHLLNPALYSLFLMTTPLAQEITAACLLAVCASDYVMTHLILKMVKGSIEKSQADNSEEISREIRMLLSNKTVFHRRFAEAYPEVIYRTERINARIAAVKAESERIRAEVQQRLNEEKQHVASTLEPATMIKSRIISKQEQLITLLYDDQRATDEQKTLKTEIDREKSRLESRQLVLGSAKGEAARK